MGEVLPIANTYSAHAPRYHALGFIPIPAKPDDKLPAVKWKELQPGMSRTELDELMASHGGASCMGTVIPIMSPFCVLDFDDGAFKNACDLWGYELPTNTPVARSGGVSASTGARDRYHVYYKWGHHRGLAKSFKEGELLEGAAVALKADKSFTVLPPSTHKSGNRYEWLPGQAPWEVDMQEIPELIVQAILRQRGIEFDKYHKANYDYKTVRELAHMTSGRNDHLVRDLGWARNQEALGFDKFSPDVNLLRKRAFHMNSLFGEPLDDAEVEKVVQSSFSMWEDAVAAGGTTSIVKNGKEYEINEVGMADRFTDEARGKAFYLSDRKTWCQFNGKFWAVQQKDAIGPQQKMMEGIARALPDEAALVEDEDARAGVKRQLDKLKKSVLGSVGKIKGLVQYCEGNVESSAVQFNQHAELINFANGVLSLDDYSFTPHDPAHRITKCAATDYVPGAKCPRWESFMMEALEGDAERVRYLQKALGYALTGDCKLDSFFVLHGQGNNGKSVMMRVLGRILGIGESGYVYPAKINSFLATRNSEDKIGNDILDMAEHRLAYAEEPRQGVRFNDGLIKDLAAGGQQTGRRLRENLQQFDFKPKLFFLCNHLPTLDDTGRGIKRRIAVIPFGAGLPDDKVDRNLPSKLMAEASGIVNWLIEGHRMLVADGDQALHITKCAAVHAATQRYIEANDRMGQFIAECIEVEPGFSDKTALVRSAYEAWCDEYGFDKASSSQAVVNEGIMSAGLGEPRKSHGESVFRGFRVNDNWRDRAEMVYGNRKLHGGKREY